MRCDEKRCRRRTSNHHLLRVAKKILSGLLFFASRACEEKWPFLCNLHIFLSSEICEIKVIALTSPWTPVLSARKCPATKSGVKTWNTYFDGCLKNVQCSSSDISRMQGHKDGSRSLDESNPFVTQCPAVRTFYPLSVKGGGGVEPPWIRPWASHVGPVV